MMSQRFSHRFAEKQARNEDGFVLATALIFLVALTILGVSALGVNSLEEKMFGYSRDRQLAFQAADAALRDGGRYLLDSGEISGATGFVAGCAGSGLYQVRTTGQPIWAALEFDTTCKDDAWAGKSSAVNAANGKSLKYGTLTGVGEFVLPPIEDGGTARSVASQPRFIIEVISIANQGTGSRKIGFGAASPMFVYRVTAIGFGQRLNSRVMLQAVYRP